MPKLTSQQLREWYQQFAKELYEQVQIDVTCKEDLGRIRHIEITKWTDEEPHAPESKPIFAYIPHNGTNYADPEPSIDNFRDYAKWMMKNFNPEVSDEQIQKLYDMSREGVLMVYQPGGGINTFQSVLTDDNGKITISVPVNAYYTPGMTVPPEQSGTQPPELVREPTPAEYGCPEFPREPENMNPGFLSWLGHILGFDTDYSKKLRYEEDLATYPERLEAWNRGELPGAGSLASYHQAVQARQTYLEEVAVFKANPYNKLSAIEYGYHAQCQMLSADDKQKLFKHEIDEAKFLEAQHTDTPLGKCATELAALEKQLSYAERTDRVLLNLVGHDPHPELLTEWVNKNVFNPDTFQPAPYQLPVDPKYDSYTDAEKQAHDKKWSDLAAVAGFAAMTDPMTVGHTLREGFTLDETIALTYSMILPNLFTEGRPNSWNELPHVEPAREKAQACLLSYNAGVCGPLAQMLAGNLRRTMREAAGLHTMNSAHTLSTLHLLGKVLNTLESDPKLLAASGLNQDELEEARGNVELYNTLTRGAEARKELLEHALSRKTLSPEQLEQYGKEALFANLVIREVAIAHNQQNAVLENSPERQKAIKEIGENSTYETMERQAAELAKTHKGEAKLMMEQANAMKKASLFARGQFMLQEFSRPGFPINKMLLNREWVEQVKNQLGEAVDLPQLASGNRKAIGDLFATKETITKATENLVVESKPILVEKEPQMQAPSVSGIQL